MKLLVVSGRSGSGKSVALRVMEDLGYYCVDNIPVNLLPTLATTVMGQYERVAVSIDVRNLPQDPDELAEILSYLPRKLELTILYLDADHASLIKRFSETRRLHPLSHQAMSLDEAISREQQLLDPISSRADLYIDTTDLNVHQLAEQLRERILGQKSGRLVILFESFGFKYGIPKDADFVFDARFLPNPHWEPDLKPLSGLDQPVKDYLAAQPVVAKYIWHINSFISSWLPHLERNNRSYLTIAIGCTGGQHRSVYMVESLAESYRNTREDVQLRHRELARHHQKS
ncbi:RNase adapter RapZ [Rheinheimera muenzenbergensis]|uniref:RNase adapter RapZ n=1 Tax=Rheinheimera muenzenbergensis TaxID=1193628 RepID=A0ABU8CA60_9GAMM|nr:RNase adapter RapZ [Gammaproteobacteria bacterium]MBU1556031.1 RNase adapter RapZ [Gammaproteobacteria bacterium]MBU2068936.1 RNase adapter RapZ [Gammaproteobacteria bacterium]MBU2181442.1 RNase adapter RapZ [Gammaproteobacteria bacterium]MBU2203811.1 RNase adapter RapZ [Gammaproteobacteria bacterium]